MGRILFVTFLSLSISGCALVLPGRGHFKPSADSGKADHARCDVNQEWDGSHCRHKGQGSGARKHDD